jgi:hypothetical protein
MTNNSDDLIIRNNDVAWRELDNHIIAVTSHDTTIHRLNAVASFIWKFLGTRGRPFPAIAGALAEKYSLSEKTARQDAVSFIKKAITHKLLLRQAPQ